MNEMQTPPVKQLRRTRDGRIIAGVCSGIGEYTGIDANILRIALAVVTFFGGLGIGVYAVAWLLIPEEGKATSIVQDLLDKQKGKRAANGWQPVDDWREPSQGATGPATTESRPAPEPEQSPAAPRPATGDQPRTDA